RWSIEFSCGNLIAAEMLAKRLMELSRSAQPDLRSNTAHQLLGTTLMWLRRPHEAREHLEEAARLFDLDLDNYLFSPIAPVVPNRAHLCWARWISGYPDQAVQCSQQVLEMALRLGRPYSIAFALQYVVSVLHLCRTYGDSRQHIENLCNVARENGFPIWLACGTISMGRMLVEEGKADAGYTMMRQGLGEVRDAGGELLHHYMLVLYAEALLLMRRLDEAMRVVYEALRELKVTNMRMLEPEIHRVRGEILSLDGNRAEAESEFVSAIDLARAQKAR